MSALDTTQATIERLLAEVNTLQHERNQALDTVEAQAEEIRKLRAERADKYTQYHKCAHCGARWPSVREADDCYVQDQRRAHG